MKPPVLTKAMFHMKPNSCQSTVSHETCGLSEVNVPRETKRQKIFVRSVSCETSEAFQETSFTWNNRVLNESVSCETQNF